MLLNSLIVWNKFQYAPYYHCIVYIYLIDASVAFDRVELGRLFKIVIERKVSF